MTTVHDDALPIVTGYGQRATHRVVARDSRASRLRIGRLTAHGTHVTLGGRRVASPCSSDFQRAQLDAHFRAERQRLRARFVWRAAGRCDAPSSSAASVTLFAIGPGVS